MPLLLLALLWFLGLFILVGVLLLPFHFTVYSIYHLLTVPFQLLKVASNPRLRSNHSLEHATMNVLEEKFGPQKTSGMAREDGFIVQGSFSPATVEICAREGLARLKNGEAQLRIHRRCGTSILASNLLASIIFIFLLWYFQVFSLMNILLAIGIAYLVGPYLGRILQATITTSTRVGTLEIMGLELARQPGFLGMLRGSGKYIVRTTSLSPSVATARRLP